MISIAEIIEARRSPGTKRRRTNRPKTMRAVRPRKRDELIYRRDLLQLVHLLLLSTERELLPIFYAQEAQFLRTRDGFTFDDFGDQIEAAMAKLRGQFSLLDAYAVAKATGLVERMDRAHQIAYFDQLKESVGIDLAGVVKSEGLEVKLAIKVKENAALIKSIAEEHLARVEKLVYANTVTGNTSAKTLAQQIHEIGGISKSRAEFIARDQTAKLNAVMNEERNLALGIEEYVWMATGGRSGDGRTRKSHREKHGRIYRFDEPPATTGNPGHDYNCRCTARPIVPGL